MKFVAHFTLINEMMRINQEKTYTLTCHIAIRLVYVAGPASTIDTILGYRALDERENQFTSSLVIITRPWARAFTFLPYIPQFRWQYIVLLQEPAQQFMWSHRTIY